MIQIRAGILYYLSVDHINKINDYVMREILYQNGIIKKYTQYSYYLYLISIYTPDECHEVDNLESIYELFDDNCDSIIELFIERGFSIENVAYMSEILKQAMTECIALSELKYDLIIDNWENNTGRIGVIYENHAINQLTSLEFEIRECESSNIVLNDMITLYGKADGVITYSPGQIYKPGTLIEIKYKGNNMADRKYYAKDMIQIAAYSVIFSCDVLYVCIYEDKHIECELYTKAVLHERFYKRFNCVINNCKLLTEMMNSDNIQDISNIVKMCKHKRKRGKGSFAENID